MTQEEKQLLLRDLCARLPQAEQKALEAYPERWYRDCDGDSWDANEKLRKGYIKGYDQAMQDFLEKAKNGWNMNGVIRQS